MTTPTATGTTQLLLDILRPNQASENWVQQAQRLNWDDFTVRAIAFGLAPQVHHKLLQWAITIPPKASAKLAVSYKAQAQRSQSIYTQLAQILAACNDADLSPIALKGVHLAACYYAESPLRPMNDIDLLFTPEELPKAEALLWELGYSGKHKSSEAGARVTKHTSTFRRENRAKSSATPNPYLSTSLDRTVEPHISLEESWFGLKADITPGIRERADTAVLTPNAPPCQVLSPTDLLHHVCLHFCFHLIQGAPAFLQLTDLLVITQANKVEWDAFLQRVHEANTAGYVLAALLLATKLVGASVPSEVVAQLSESTPLKLRQRIDQMDLAYVLRRTQQKPLVTMSDRLRRGIKDRMEIARWAPTFAEKWRIWQTAVQFTRTDTAKMLRKYGEKDI